MKKNWFKRRFITYVPVSLMGWLILLAILVYAVYTFIDIDSRSHSASDTIMNFAFNMLLVYIIYLIVGFLTSRQDKE
jgi:membrane protein DedA with SNARE-associated domain